MAWWKPLARLVAGWGLMLAGVLVLLDSNLPASRPRNRTWLAAQAVAGFALVIAGWWLRRGAMRPPEKPE
jgi:hypothetical protein